MGVKSGSGRALPCGSARLNTWFFHPTFAAQHRVTSKGESEGAALNHWFFYMTFQGVNWGDAGLGFGRTLGKGWSSWVLGECHPRARVTCLYTSLRTDLAICPRGVPRCFPPSPAPSKYDEGGNSMLNRLYGAGRSEALYPSPNVEISLFSSPLGHHSNARGKMGKQRDQTSSRLREMQ